MAYESHRECHLTFTQDAEVGVPPGARRPTSARRRTTGVRREWETAWPWAGLQQERVGSRAAVRVPVLAARVPVEKIYSDNFGPKW